MKLVAWKKLVHGTLRGFADLELTVEGGHALVVHECPVFQGSRGPWVSFPGKPQLDREGAVVRTTRGKIAYTATASWGGGDSGKRFSQAAIKLLLAAHPDALDDPERLL